MSKQHRDMGLLFAVSLIVRLLTIVPIQEPGYMDAAYSYDIALSLARGDGFVEPFLWNYLDDPAGLPHPSHLYWMPLPSMLAWVGLTILGQSYRAAQVPFVILAALLPVVSYWVAVQTTGRRRHGWLAGLLTLFSGFYVVYWGHTDNFTPFALAGSLSLIAAWQAGRARESDRLAAAWALAAGVLVGLAHLSRADGLLLLIAIGLAWVVALISDRLRRQAVRGWSLGVRHILLVVLGYVVVMLPWFIRNWSVAGAPLPAAGAQTVWLRTYDDLFSYGRELSLSSYLAWGWPNIFRSKLDALWLNLQTVLAVLCMIFLAPLVPIGWWRLRRHPLYQLGAWYGLLLILAMTFVFTFPGPRGGLFHSGGALLPFIFTAALVGLDILIEWLAVRRRGWDVRLARQVFGIGIVGLALLVSGFLYYQEVIGEPRRQEEAVTYLRLVEWLEAESQRDAVVMVGNPPGYWYQGGGPSIVVPNEPVEMVLAVADRYGARYLILDHNRPTPLDPLYTGTKAHPRLALAYTFDDGMDRPVHIFHIIAPTK
jgi:4-amino-4-deoxy-L-arabinose transferase-like glycosyltransferase